MEETEENMSDNGNADSSKLKWKDIKRFPHRYIFEIPKKLAETPEIEQDLKLPMPIFNPTPILNYDRELFKTKSKRDTRLAYYRKLYAKSDKAMLRKLIEDKKYAALPQYVVDVADGAFDDDEDHAWHYTGGTLDCLIFNDKQFVARAGLHQDVEITDLNRSTITTSAELKSKTPVYNVKFVSSNRRTFLATRQKSKISLFSLSNDDESLKVNLVWKSKKGNSFFVDMDFNKYGNTEIATLDSNHNLQIKDFTKSIKMGNYRFSSDFDKLDDQFGQIKYVDCNTFAFINRCCFYLLDMRSLNVQKSCLKTSLLTCDDLCTFSKKNSNCFDVSSQHNVANFDIRSLKCINRVAHMLSTAPFISSYMDDCLCLSGQSVGDKVSFSSSDSYSLPRKIPSTKDGFTKACLTGKLNASQHLEDRFSLPTLGMKLCEELLSGDSVLYTLNSVGDVFRQKVVEQEEAAQWLAEWANTIPHKPKELEATSICNLNDIMHTISSNFSEAKILKTFMKENRAQELFNKECPKPTFVESSIGEAMSGIWDVEPAIVPDTEPTLPSTSKVSEWLDSVP